MRTDTGDAVVSDSNERVSQLRREHAALDKQLEELNENLYLTPAETMEIVKLKRQKLAIKDQIHRIMLATQT